MKKVKIYTTPTCQYCKMAKEFFKEKGIDYEEFDVASNEKARNEMVEKTGQLGVPVIEIDGEYHVGFNPQELSKALGV